MSEYPTEAYCFKRRVALALGEMSPQVITETLYCLCIKHQPPFVPTDVYLITTTAGKEEAIDGLLDENVAFHQFLEDYNLQGRTAFTVENLHSHIDTGVRPLSDVRTEANNINAADFITEKIRQLTSDSECALHVSISGGRNIIQFYH
jgi:CRISPR-associated protein (TIGR02584 family)